MTKPSYIEPETGILYPLDHPRWCSEERLPLLVTSQQGISREEIDKQNKTLWRYRAALPLDIADPITMGEGLTPLVQKTWSDHRPFFKLEWFNPTGSFKDRGSSVMLSYLRQHGIRHILEDSSGNGGSSMAGYGAAGGLKIKILTPASTSPGKIAQARAYGAEVQLVEGPREESEAEAIRQSSGEAFYASHNWQAFFLEGTKTLAYEIWEDFGFKSPDNIIIPVGAGSSVLGLHFGFRELERAGEISKLPRLFVAQPLNCSPIDASFKAVAGSALPRPVLKTIAEGAAIKHPIRLKQIIQALRESCGDTVAVEEHEIIGALRKTCAAGFFIEPTSATATAALDRLVSSGAIKPEETTVVMLSGTGLKAAAIVGELLEGPAR
ncbi:threonine synthase [Neorhizobium galegae]|uniref:threonine synthase n=1 Tax=Neorhizobium galegae TaxID=399 RepID=UPI000622B2C4|nr:threonine synthase [Neorhizobium galegae]CDZ55174.1 Threonine synthase [Neorhizobium galegae bv. orientalis]